MNSIAIEKRIRWAKLLIIIAASITMFSLAFLDGGVPFGTSAPVEKIFLTTSCVLLAVSVLFGILLLRFDYASAIETSVRQPGPTCSPDPSSEEPQIKPQSANQLADFERALKRQTHLFSIGIVFLMLFAVTRLFIGGSKFINSKPEGNTNPDSSITKLTASIHRLTERLSQSKSGYYTSPGMDSIFEEREQAFHEFVNSSLAKESDDIKSAIANRVDSLILVRDVSNQGQSLINLSKLLFPFILFVFFFLIIPFFWRTNKFISIVAAISSAATLFHIVVEAKFELKPTFKLQVNIGKDKKDTLIVEKRMFTDTIRIGSFDQGWDTLHPDSLAVGLNELKRHFTNKQLSVIYVFGGVDIRPLKPNPRKKFGENLSLALARANKVRNLILESVYQNKVKPDILTFPIGASVIFEQFDTLGFAKNRSVWVYGKYEKSVQ